MSRLSIDNATARRLWLHVSGLDTRAAAGTPLQRACATVDALGMVQLDPIRTVARAHDHILWSRGPTCRPPLFERLIRKRCVFEHFSHDAVILPMHYWPVWRRQLQRRADRFARAAFGGSPPPATDVATILARIDQDGPLASRDFKPSTGRKLQAWSKPTHKLVLDWLWLTGTLAVADRTGFAKRYDRVEHIVPRALLEQRLDDAGSVDTLLRDALQRMGVASSGELQRFWDATTREETTQWIQAQRSSLIEVDVQGADGRVEQGWALPDLEDRLASLPEPANRVRMLNPFDPAIRDRRRVARLFGFSYTIEIYVPPAQRTFGYYVYPVLDGDCLIGRADIVRRTSPERLSVRAFWPEPGVRLGKARVARIEAELARFARLAGVDRIEGSPKPVTQRNALGR